MDGRFIGIELRSLNNAVRRYLENSESPLAEDKLTCSNAWIIGYLSRAHGDVYQRDHEEEFGVTRSTISKVIMLLEKKGIIQRVSVPHDARLKKLELTEKGKEAALKMAENGARMEARLTKGFTDEELLQLADYMQRMRENLGEKAEVIHNTDKGEEI